MSATSTIEWTDATWNPVVGCSVVSPGCTHCYAMKLAGGRLRNHSSRAGLTQPSKAGPVWTGKVRLWEPWLTQPFEWKTPRRIFVCAHGDLFHEDVPDDWIDKVFALMALTPQHTYQVLTKRAKRMRGYFEEPHPAGNVRAWQARVLEKIDELVPERTEASRAARDRVLAGPLANVWLGVSAEDQARADERIPHLLATPAAKRFISAEPLLGAIDLAPWLSEEDGCGGCDDGPPPRCGRDDIPREEQCPTKLAVFETHEREVEGQDHPDVWVTRTTLDWVIAGGESGLGARPSHPDWFRSLRDQCAAAGVPFFFKQWGSWRPEIDRDRDDPDWRRDYGVVNRKPDRFEILNLAGGCGFHGERVHLMAKGAKKAAGAEIDGKTHREFPT